MRRAALAAVVAGLVLAVQAGAGAGKLVLVPVGRLAFPMHGFVVDLPGGAQPGRASVTVRENGKPVENVALASVASSDLSLGTVLAVDASDSMAGAPETAALDAAREFVSKQSANEQTALVAFNANVDVLSDPTGNASALRAALASPPRVAYGTHIYDALDQSLDLLEAAQVSSGAIVLLSDGADVGSRATFANVVARANRDNVRIFTVGFRSSAFDARALQLIAQATNGTFTLAASTAQLPSIYAGLGKRLTSEYVVEYRSLARLGQHVTALVSVPGYGVATSDYVASNSSSPYASFHEPLGTRLLLSPASLVILALLVAGLLGGALLLVLRPSRTTLVDRVSEFAPTPAPRQEVRRQRRAVNLARNAVVAGSRRGLIERWWSRLQDDFETAEIPFGPELLVSGTFVATVLVFVLLASISLPLGLVAILVPVAARSWISAEARRVRTAFADALPDTLQLLASALRTGHTFIGAINVVVEQAPQAVKDEFRRVVSDDRLGIPTEVSLRSIARRMHSRDMEQVALLSELARSAGGNSAEVLDVVVETVRERAEVRRLARTLTAQGRMSRWILTVMPIVIGLFLFVTRRSLMHPLYSTQLGQFALVVAGLMIVAGSVWIREIVNITV